jgi:AcrR family transcriptional regulator
MTVVKRSRGGTQPDPLSRADILDATMPLVAEHGIDGVSLRMVADALGISSPALYHYFSGRDDLLDRCCERVAAEVDLTVDPTARWDDAIVAVILNMHRAFARYPGVAARVLPAQRPSRAADRISGVVYELALGAGYSPDAAEDLLAAMRVVFGGWLLGRRSGLSDRTTEPALLERIIRWTIAGFAQAESAASDRSNLDPQQPGVLGV